MSEETSPRAEFTRALGFVDAQIGTMQDDEKLVIIEKLRPGADITEG